MRRGQHQKREKAFRLRVERKTFAEISREIGVSPKTLSRWENGWVDGKGNRNPGWKPELDKAWKELSETQLQYGLMLKEERLRTYEELAQLAIARIKEMFPAIRAKTAADAKALLSEVRELLKLIAEEKGELRKDPKTMVAVKTDINLNDLSERYTTVHADSGEDNAEPGRVDPLALDD